MAQKVLILFAHPTLHRSVVNKQMIQKVQKMENVTFHDLYETYPDFLIDVKHEQNLLMNHDVIVLHHPFYWYSAPAIVKEWCDLVLEYGFAYGENGIALRGKSWVHVITAGGSEQAYTEVGRNRFTVDQLLAPFNQTAHLCEMKFLSPFIVFGTLQLDPTNEVMQVSYKYEKFISELRGN